MSTSSRAEPLLSLLRPVRWRLRLARVLRMAWLGLHGVLLAAVVAGLLRLGGMDRGAMVLLLVAAAAFMLLLLGALLWPVRPLQAAMRIDRAGGLRSLVASATELVLGPAVPWPRRAALAGGDPAFAGATVRLAMARGRQVSPKQAVPWPRPHPPWAVLGLAVLAAGLWALPRPVAPVAPGASTSAQGAAVPAPEPVEAVDPAELEGFEEEAGRLAGRIEDAALRQLADEYEALLEALAAGRIDRVEALKRLDALSKRAAQLGDDEEQQALEEVLQRLARQLDRPGPLRAVGEALQREGPRAAAEAMRRQADRLAAGQLDRRALRQLREQLRRLAAREQELDRALRRNARDRERLLRERERLRQARTERERRLLRRRERQLRRLRREQQRLEAERRMLQRLRRQAAQGAERLSAGDLGGAAEAMDRGAEDLDRAGSDRQRAEQREAMRRLMETLREAIQRHRRSQGGGQGGRGSGGGRRQRMRRFVLRAGGGRGGARLLLPGQGGQQGQGQQGQGQ